MDNNNIKPPFPMFTECIQELNTMMTKQLHESIISFNESLTKEVTRQIDSLFSSSRAQMQELISYSTKGLHEVAQSMSTAMTIPLLSLSDSIVGNFSEGLKTHILPSIFAGIKFDNNYVIIPDETYERILPIIEEATPSESDITQSDGKRKILVKWFVEKILPGIIIFLITTTITRCSSSIEDALKDATITDENIRIEVIIKLEHQCKEDIEAISDSVNQFLIDSGYQQQDSATPEPPAPGSTSSADDPVELKYAPTSDDESEYLGKTKKTD